MARWGGQAGPCAGDDHLRECVTGSSTRPMALTTGQSSGHGSGGARTPGPGTGPNGDAGSGDGSKRGRWPAPGDRRQVAGAGWLAPGA